MQAANIKIMDLLGGVSPKPQGGAIGGNVESGESKEAGFAELLINLSGGPAPVATEELFLPADDAGRNESEPEQALQSVITVPGIASDNSEALELTPPAKSELVQSSKNLQSLIELLKGKSINDALIQNVVNDDSLVENIDKQPLLMRTVPSSDKNHNSLPVSLSGIEPDFDFANNSLKSITLEEQLKQLNAKEVEIKIHKEDATAVEKPFILNTTAAKLKEQIENNVLVQNRRGENLIPTPSIVAASLNDAAEEGDLADGQFKPGENQETKPAVVQTDAVEEGPEIESLLNHNIKTTQIKPELNTITDLKSVWSKNSDSGDSTAETLKSVKIVLPENAKLSSALRHQTIMIKIEPDHLGPARLDLQLRHDIFSAKLTVETYEAKTVLEHSLSSLKEQLARADIKVEQIEINVRGETNYNQLFDKQPQWQKNAHINQFRFSNEELNEQFMPAANSFVPEKLQYVNQSGVNVLA